MRGLKFTERFKSTQIHALNSSETSGSKNSESSSTAKLNKYGIRSFGSTSKPKFSNSVSAVLSLFPFHLPTTDSIEPTIEPYLKPINLIESLADIYHMLESCPQSAKTSIYIEQYSLLRNLGDQKLLRQCLRTTRQNAEDVLSKVVLSAWMRYERREDELVGVSSMDCGGYILECPKANLINGYKPTSFNERCHCSEDSSKGIKNKNIVVTGCVCLPDEQRDVLFCIGKEEINCVRYRIAALSDPFKAMLYGDFKESKMGRIDFSRNGICPKGMRAVESYSRTKRLDIFCPKTILELLSFANRFCCEEMKTACDAHLASIVSDIEDALVLINYGLEEKSALLVASCLQVLLRELPNSLHNSKVIKIFCSLENKERLDVMGYASFLLYYLLSQVAMEDNMVSETTLMLLENLRECSTERWQKALAFHQLGCVLLEMGEYKDAQRSFEAAAEAGHVYSMAGVARTKHKLGQPYSAYKLISSLISEYNPAGWMYQERAFYNIVREKSLDLDIATELDPTLSYPYKYRALARVEDRQTKGGISVLDKIIGFKLSLDCLELRAWLYIALEDYESAMRDIRSLLTLDPSYITLHGKITGEYLVQLLGHRVEQKSLADCWMQLYEQWACVDDIGSLAIIHQMLETEPQKSLLEFRQSLLLLR